MDRAGIQVFLKKRNKQAGRNLLAQESDLVHAQFEREITVHDLTINVYVHSLKRLR